MLGVDRLREDQSDLANWTRGDRKARFRSEGASPTLSALRAYHEHRAAGCRGVPPDAPLDFTPAALQPLIRQDGVTDRRRWESALFLKVRDEIQTGNLAIAGAKNFGRSRRPSCPPPSGGARQRSPSTRRGGRAAEGTSVGCVRPVLGRCRNRQVAFDDDGWRLKTDADEQPDIIEDHTPPGDVGRIAVRAGVERLVLTHFVPSGLPQFDRPELWLEAVRPHFAGEIIVGRDLLEIAF